MHTGKNVLTLALLSLAILVHPIPSNASERSAVAAGQAAARIREYVGAVNSGSRLAVREWMQRHFDGSSLNVAPDMQAQVLTRPIYESGGKGFTVVTVLPSEAGSVAAILRNNLTGSWTRLQMSLSANSPERINGYPRFESTAAPSGAPGAETLSDRELADRLDAAVQKMAADEEFSGVVLLAREGKPVHCKAYGLASKSFQVANQPGTQFNIASVGKMFTAVSILQLAEKGLLSLDDPISKYVSSDWVDPVLGAKIQIKHLLTHTSGFGTYFEALNRQAEVAFFRELDDYKALVRSERPAFEPGTRWNYSNTGAVLLGVIIEKVSHQEYFDYLRKHIFEPAGMTATAPLERDSAQPGHATGYVKGYRNGQIFWRENTASRVLKGNPSGGIYSNVDDLLRFDIALRSHALLSAQSTEMALSSKPELNSTFYGYGFYTSEGAAGRAAGHGGDGTGINCQFKMYLDRGYTVVVLSNYGAPSANIIEVIAGQLISATTPGAGTASPTATTR